MGKIAQLEGKYQDYFSRLADRMNSGAVLADLPNWLCKKTMLGGEPFSFKDHEFQIDIVRDRSPESDTQKCSQVGMSEIQARCMLAIASIMTAKVIIYVMPHNKLASVFAKSRVDPIIDSSSTLKDQMRMGSDSAYMKQIGSSFIHFAGAESDRSAISIPAQILLIDEYDFCKMSVLGKFSSRLRHAGDDAMVRRFSTPTVSNYGISKNVAMSNQLRYMVKCLHCNEWSAPIFAKDVVIPGFDKDFIKIDKDDFLNDAYKFNDAYLACSKCKRELDSALAIAERREWVAKYPSRSAVGREVKPFDLIKYNATPKIILQRKGYDSDQDYWNFVHGEPLDTDQNKINDVMVEACTTGEFYENGHGLCIGIDVGKVCHYMIGKKMGERREVVAMGKFRLTDGELKPQAMKIMDNYGFSRTVIDAGPDITLPAGLQEQYGIQFVNPCVYVKPKKGEMVWYVFNEDTGVVNASRTKALDHFVASINKGKWRFPRHEMMREVRAHMKEMVRVEQPNDDGEKEAVWETSSATNHFFHAGFYLHCAMEMEESGVAMSFEGVPLNITGVLIGNKAQKKPLVHARASSDGGMAAHLASLLGKM